MRPTPTSLRRLSPLALPLLCAVLAGAGCQGAEINTNAEEGGDAPGDPAAASAAFTTASTWTVGQAVAMAETGVGFSYKWGGGCWQPGQAHGACYGSCPNCTHSGAWGADCSGYVGKVWQVPGPSATSACSHPYSTASFVSDTGMWKTIPRSQVKRGDAFVYNTGGHGHIFMFDRGDPWGSVVAYEASGCASGIRHGTRTASSTFKVIRRTGF